MRESVVACLLISLTTTSGFILNTIFGDPPETVKQLNPAKYLGRWYQMYASTSVTNVFEKGARCVTADYGLSNDGRITVLNSERVNSPTGTLKVIHGFANMTGIAGHLKVALETVSFAAPYWVLKLGPETFGPNKLYEYSVVSDNVKGTLFVLARNPTDFKKKYDTEVRQFLISQGFTAFYNRPEATYQGSDFPITDT